jgi:RpiR family carbohydrate utilization transcriptional regulator
VLDRIRASIPALPPAEQRVAKLVLADARSFTSLPVAELAERARVSKPTVVRFCRSVGYDGLADFKLKLAGSVNDRLPFAHRAVDDADTANELIVKLIDNAAGALLKYRNRAAGHAFERAIDALAQATRERRRIVFCGVGDSGVVAQDAQHKFFRFGAHAAAASDGHVQLTAATLQQSGDCAVLISASGRSRDLLDAADIARRKGATTVLVTASASPLAQTATGSQQILLAVDPAEDGDRFGPMATRLLQLVIVDIVATGVALKLGGELKPLLQEIRRNLRAKRYAP